MAGVSELGRAIRGRMFRLPHMINCRAFESYVQEFLDETLPENQLRVFRLHLRVCPECRIYLAAYRTTVELGKAVFAVEDDLPVPEQVPADLIRAILAARAAS